MYDVLKDLGINIGLAVAGFFGSLMMIGRESAQNIKQTLMSIIAGVASANYLTPVVADILGIVKINYMFSIAFILGFLGLKGVELISNKIVKQKIKG
jgi:hypothetical protein